MHREDQEQENILDLKKKIQNCGIGTSNIFWNPDLGIHTQKRLIVRIEKKVETMIMNC